MYSENNPQVGELFYLIQFGLLTWEREGEANRKLFVFDLLFLHEIPKTLCYVVKQLLSERIHNNPLVFVWM